MNLLTIAALVCVPLTTTEPGPPSEPATDLLALLNRTDDPTIVRLIEERGLDRAVIDASERLLRSDATATVTSAGRASAEQPGEQAGEQAAQPTTRGATHPVATLGIGAIGDTRAGRRHFYPPVYDEAAPRQLPSFEVTSARMPEIAATFAAITERINACVATAPRPDAPSPEALAVTVALDSDAHIVGVQVIEIRPAQMSVPADCVWTAVRTIVPPRCTTTVPIELRYRWTFDANAAPAAEPPAVEIWL